MVHRWIDIDRKTDGLIDTLARKKRVSRSRVVREALALLWVMKLERDRLRSRKRRICKKA